MYTHFRPSKETKHIYNNNNNASILYSAFLSTQRRFTETIIHSHTVVPVVVSYTCSHSCPGADWRKRGCQFAPNGPSDHHQHSFTYIHIHTRQGGLSVLPKDTMTATWMERDSNRQPFGHWTIVRVIVIMMSEGVNHGPSCRSVHGDLQDEGAQRLQGRSQVSNMN